jgi:Mor family transcriptional regulator
MLGTSITKNKGEVVQEKTEKITAAGLKVLQKNLKTDAAIGAKFGISRQAVHQWRIKFGIKAMTARNDERNAKIVKSYKKGRAVVEIAKELDLSVSQVYRIVKR